MESLYTLFYLQEKKTVNKTLNSRRNCHIEDVTKQNYLWETIFLLENALSDKGEFGREIQHYTILTLSTNGLNRYCKRIERNVARETVWTRMKIF